jgi:YHS domain-containing protein
VIFLSITSVDLVQAGKIKLKVNGNSEAISRYDPVAYFTMSRAIKGSKDFSYEWLGAKWFFVNEEHKKLFADDPIRYLPQYGGYCSVSVAHGTGRSAGDPTAWRIVDDKLYFFNSRSTAFDWNQNNAKVRKADAKWENVKAGLVQ